VTEADIVNFAGLSGDFHPVHTNEEFAKATPFGGRIAHGLLTLSIGNSMQKWYRSAAGICHWRIPQGPLLNMLRVEQAQ
jgi:acyl dehydratase